MICPVGIASDLYRFAGGEGRRPLGRMISYAKAAMEREMKVQEVIMRALAKKITWWPAAEIIGISDRQMRSGIDESQPIAARAWTPSTLA